MVRHLEMRRDARFKACQVIRKAMATALQAGDYGEGSADLFSGAERAAAATVFRAHAFVGGTTGPSASTRWSPRKTSTDSALKPTDGKTMRRPDAILAQRHVDDLQEGEGGFPHDRLDGLWMEMRRKAGRQGRERL